MSEAIAEESPSEARFTLRKLLGLVWGVGAILGAYRFGGSEDLYPLFFLGIPAAVLGYRLITWQRCGWLLTTSLLLFFAYGSLTTWVWPRMICPIDLPASAKNLKVRDNWGFAWDGGDTQVTFHAPVKDCRSVLKQLERKYYHEFDSPTLIEASNYRWNPAAAPWYYSHSAGVPGWFDPNRIQEGEYYPGPVLVWIDTKRGIFYMESYY